MSAMGNSVQPFREAPRWIELGIGASLFLLVIVSLAFAFTGVQFLPGAEFGRAQLTALRIVALVAGVGLGPLALRVLSGRSARADGGLFRPAALYVAATVCALAGAGSLLLPGILKLHALEGIAGAIGCAVLARSRVKRSEV